jgi:hypothetical protein
MAFCSNCGAQMSEGATTCPQCGHPTGQPAAAYAGVAQRTEGLAVTSLVLGIAGFAICPLVCHILAIVLGTQARNKIRNDPTLGGDGLARAGVILGWVGVGLTVLFAIIAILAFAVGGHATFHISPNR